MLRGLDFMHSVLWCTIAYEKTAMLLSLCYRKTQDYLSVISLVREVLIWCDSEELHEVNIFFPEIRVAVDLVHGSTLFYSW